MLELSTHVGPTGTDGSVVVKWNGDEIALLSVDLIPATSIPARLEVALGDWNEDGEWLTRNPVVVYNATV